MSMKPTHVGMLVLKLLVTGSLLVWVFHKVDVGPLAARLGHLHTGWGLAALAILFGQLLLTGIRWYFVGQLVGAGIGVGLATRLILIGQFFNQVLPSSVGGDGVRAWLLSREGISIKHALVSVICDRAAALVLLVVIVACTMPIVIMTGDVAIPSGRLFAAAIGVIAVAGWLLLYWGGNYFSAWLMRIPFARPIGVVVRDLRRVLLSSKKSIGVVGLTVLVQVMVVASTDFCALALGVKFGVVHLLMLPLIMLVSSIPLSFAGWGLRESAMVTGLGFAGISAGDALAVSVSFGIAQLVIGLPGVAVIAVSKSKRSHEYLRK